MTRTLIVANWKMNLNTQQASLLLHAIEKKITPHRDVETVICPNALVLQSLSLQHDRRTLKLGAQNCYWRDEGPYTGEVSATMLRGLVDYCLVGHSERRHIFGETNHDVRNKVQALVRNHITPIMCVGETTQERNDGETNHVLHDQVVNGLANLTGDEVAKLVIAYEPVWAISSGKNFADHPTPKPDDITVAIKNIRHQIAHLFGKNTAEAIRVIYGGSTNSGNAQSFLAIPEVDGFLIGGASLNEHEFSDIVKAAHERK